MASQQALTVLFADLAGSTRIYEAEGDVQAHRRVTSSLGCMREVVQRYDGKLLRTVGDAVLASFDDTDAAHLASIDIQREHQKLNLSVRVGFHHGDVIPDSGDIYGNAVNLAARVAAFAEADEICVTEQTVLRLSRVNRAAACYLDKVEFKGIKEPVPVYRVQWTDDQSVTAIFSPSQQTQRCVSNRVLELLVGGKRICIDHTRARLSFGRSLDNDVIIDAEPTSRFHCCIEHLRGRFLLHDFSTNGTYLIRNGVASEFIRRESVSLDHFGRIGLGASPDTSVPHVVSYRVL